MTEDYRNRLVAYFKKNLAKGYTPDSLTVALTNQGYARAIVDRSLEQATKEIAEKAPILETKPKIRYDIIDEYNKPITVKKSWWRSLFGL